MDFDFSGIKLNLKSPHIMGVLNITPDSFSDGGMYNHLDTALQQARAMLQMGASIIDVGGESTRPGSTAVSEEEELSRVIPVIKALRQDRQAVISIDTSKPEVMRQAVACGANLINDINALQSPGALEAAAELQVPVCLMHMQNAPATMQQRPVYNNVIDEVSAFFKLRISDCEAAGISKDKIILDPGFGFGKTLQHNLTLLKELARFKQFNLPILVGLSRKSMFGQILNKPVEDRLHASLSAALIAVTNGACIVRVHDVEQTSDVLRVYHAVSQQQV